MNSTALFIGFGLAGFILCGALLATSMLDRYRRVLDDRVRAYKSSGSAAKKLVRRPGVSGAELDASHLRAWHRIRGHIMPVGDVDRKLHQSRLLQAGIYSATALSTFFLFRLALMLIPVTVGLVLSLGYGITFQRALLPGCIAGVLGMLLPSFWLDHRIKRRHRELGHGVPDLLDILTVCLEGGMSMQVALQRVGDELRVAHPALAGELLIAQREIDLGISMPGALERLADRTGYEGLRRLSGLVREAQRHGSELASALRLHSDSLRDQREAEAEEQAQKASVKILIPTLLFIFPAVFVVLAAPAAIRIHETFSHSEEVRASK